MVYLIIYCEHSLLFVYLHRVLFCLGTSSTICWFCLNWSRSVGQLTTNPVLHWLIIFSVFLSTGVFNLCFHWVTFSIVFCRYLFLLRLRHKRILCWNSSTEYNHVSELFIVEEPVFGLLKRKESWV